jgi:hypothetical protein
MKFPAWRCGFTPILGLLLALSAGCASTLKPVKCDGRLEPINKPALPANTAPVAKVPQSAASPSISPVVDDGNGIP